MASKAKHGYAAFCRQDFVGIDYGMVDCLTNDPLPDYWGSVLWSRLMGSGVARAASNSTSSSLRAYAHCHPTSKADLTVLLLNLNSAARRRGAWSSGRGAAARRKSTS